MDCKICSKHLNKDKFFILETSYFEIWHGVLDSHILGYIYLEPKRHVENWVEFTQDELVELPFLIQKIEGLLKKLVNADRVYTVTISEAVRHLHFHLIPRIEDSNLKGLNLIEQATQQIHNQDLKITQEEIDNLIVAIRNEF